MIDLRMRRRGFIGYVVSFFGFLMSGCVSTTGTMGRIQAKTNSRTRSMSEEEKIASMRSKTIMDFVERSNYQRVPVGVSLHMEGEMLIEDVKRMPVALSDVQMLSIGRRLDNLAKRWTS